MDATSGGVRVVRDGMALQIEAPLVLPAHDIASDQRCRIDDCPVQHAIGTIADKWKILILLALTRAGVVRFKALQRELGTVSQKVLTNALREMERDGLVERTVYAEVPPRVEYRPTPRTAALLPILAQLQLWATTL